MLSLDGFGGGGGFDPYGGFGGGPGDFDSQPYDGMDPWANMPWYSPQYSGIPTFGGTNPGSLPTTIGGMPDLSQFVSSTGGSPSDSGGGGFNLGGLLGGLGGALGGIFGGVFGGGGGGGITTPGTNGQQPPGTGGSQSGQGGLGGLSASTLAALLGGGTGILGAILQNNANNRKNDLLKQYADKMSGVYDSKSATGDKISTDILGSLKQIGMLSGYNPQMQDILAKSSGALDGLYGQFFNFTNDPTYQSAINGVGGMLNNPALSQMINKGSELTQGNNPQANAVSGAANPILANAGMTPQIQAALSALMHPLQTGGGNALTQALGSHGLDLFGRESLLPMNQVLGMAKDQAAQNTKQAASAALAQAHARGGDAAVGTGLGNEALVDFGDAAAANQSKAITDALLGQQQLQLSQAGLGANAAQAAGGLANQKFGTAVGGTADLTGASTQRLGTAGNLDLGAANTILQQVLGGGNLVNSTMNTSGGLADLLSKINTASQTMNLQRGTGYNSALTSILGLNSNVSQNAMSNLMNAIGQYGQIGQNYMSLGNNALGNISGLLGNYGATSPLGNLLVNGGMGVMAGSMGNNNGPGFKYPGVYGGNGN
jgi:hypothetical protein